MPWFYWIVHDNKNKVTIAKRPQQNKLWQLSINIKMTGMMKFKTSYRTCLQIWLELRHGHQVVSHSVEPINSLLLTKHWVMFQIVTGMWTNFCGHTGSATKYMYTKTSILSLDHDYQDHQGTHARAQPEFQTKCVCMRTIVSVGWIKRCTIKRNLKIAVQFTTHVWFAYSLHDFVTPHHQPPPPLKILEAATKIAHA